MIRLVSGDYFDNNNYDIKDIAHSLSMICRWGGHTLTWHSVAEHSVRVCWALEGRDRCYGLLHDAAEYIWGDLCSPLKVQCPDYCAAINGLQRSIYRHFGLLDTARETIEVADLKIRQWEYEKYVTNYSVSWSQQSACERFLDAFGANFEIT